MPHSPAPHDSLFVPSVPAELRGAPIAGSMVLAGGITMFVAVYLPWQIYHNGLFVHESFGRGSAGMLTLAMGMLAVITGIVMRTRASRGTRRLALLTGLVASGVGGYAVYDIAAINRQAALLPIHPAPITVVGTGLYVLGIGVLLAVVGSFLQRGASSSRRVG